MPFDEEITLEEYDLELLNELKRDGIINRDEIRKNLISYDKLQFSTTVDQIDLYDLEEMDTTTNFFSFPDNEEFLDLVSSVEMLGIVTPLVVTKRESDEKYTVVCGRNRLLALRSLYANSKDDRFRSVPCILLGKTDPMMLQGLIIASNLKYRKVSLEDRIKSIFILDTILSKNKKYRNEYNIAEVIAQKTGVTRNTVNNYLALRGLSDTAMDLVNKGHLNLTIARMLARVSHEKQDDIINTLEENINDFNKVRSLTSKTYPQSCMKDEKTGKMVPLTWELHLESAKRAVEEKTTIKITVVAELVGELLNKIFGVKDEYMKLNQIKNGNKYMKINVVDRHMRQYLNRGFISQNIYDKAVPKKDPKGEDLLKTLGL